MAGRIEKARSLDSVYEDMKMTKLDERQKEKIEMEIRQKYDERIRKIVRKAEKRIISERAEIGQCYKEELHRITEQYKVAMKNIEEMTRFEVELENLDLFSDCPLCSGSHLATQCILYKGFPPRKGYCSRCMRYLGKKCLHRKRDCKFKK